MSLHNTRPDPTLPADHAFVVQLRRGTALTAQKVVGEIEHIVSGQHCEFHSFAELAAFIERILNPKRQSSP
jgi:hypothetical protein